MHLFNLKFGVLLYELIKRFIFLTELGLICLLKLINSIYNFSNFKDLGSLRWFGSFSGVSRIGLLVVYWSFSLKLKLFRPKAQSFLNSFNPVSSVSWNTSSIFIKICSTVCYSNVLSTSVCFHYTVKSGYSRTKQLMADNGLFKRRTRLLSKNVFARKVKDNEWMDCSTALCRQW